MDIKSLLCEPKDQWISPHNIKYSIYKSSSSSNRCRTLSEYGKNHVFIYSSRRQSVGTSLTRTPWNPYEDELLRRGYNQGLSWALISSTYLPHRSRGCCWGRFKTLQNKNLTDHTRCFKRPWRSVQFEHD